MLLHVHCDKLQPEAKSVQLIYLISNFDHIFILGHDVTMCESDLVGNGNEASVQKSTVWAGLQEFHVILLQVLQQCPIYMLGCKNLGPAA